MAFLNIAPTGTVLPFAGSTAPEGWLICNGSSQSTTTYAKLFAVIGYTYGGTGASFNLPDMQGVFPRGAGTNLTNNYGGVTSHQPAGGSLATKGGQKTAKNGLSTSAGTASVSGNKNQLDASTGSGSFVSQIRAVDASGASAAYNHVRGYGSGAFVDYLNTTEYPGSAHSHSFSYTGTFSASGSTSAQTVGSADTETTPAFLALNYIIKL